jgi:hypothetical protein
MWIRQGFTQGGSSVRRKLTLRLDLVSPDEHSRFREQKASIEADMKTAQEYLDRTAHHYGPHVGLPVAGLHNTKGRLSTAAWS